MQLEKTAFGGHAKKSTVTPTDPRVQMVGLLAQPEKGLVRPDDVAELQLWSSWRLLVNASCQGGLNQPRKTEKNWEIHAIFG